MTGPSTSPYTPPTEGSYNASPPPDDGSQTDANKLKYSTIKTKLSDVVRAFALAVDTAITTMAAKTINTDSGVANVIGGNIAFEPSNITLATDIIIPSRTYHLVDTEGAAASDNLVTITNTNMAANAILYISAANTARTVVVKHGSGNIFLTGSQDFSLDDDIRLIALQRRGNSWYEIFRSGAGALDVQVFLVSGTWTKPATGTLAQVQVWGAGASGGKGSNGACFAAGGGGGYNAGTFRLTQLSATETVTLGAGGAAQSGASTAGTAGGNTTFGSRCTGFGGGTNGTIGGGGGGGLTAAGSNGAVGTGGAGGNGVTAGGAANTSSLFGGGGGGSTTNPGGHSVYGGGGGGGDATTGGSGNRGGDSVYGGGGGGGGANGTSSAPGGAATYSGGVGGAGGFDANAAVAGTQPGGGGGGSETGTSGAGADGMCIVTVF